jgi:hypothetical protein
MDQGPIAVALQSKHFSARILSMDIQAHIELLRERLQSSGMTRDQIAAATGGALSASWVSKFASGRMRNPRVDSLLALERAIDSRPSKAA